MASRIGEYSPLSELQTAGSGSARWCIASRGGQPFFLKQFLSPVYPADANTPIKEKQRERCRQFERRKQRLYSAMSCVLGDTLVPVLDFFRYDGHYYAASEAVATQINGENKDGLTDGEKRQVLYHLALCLQRLHMQNVVHADLKPEHILLTARSWGYQVRLIDLDSGFLLDDPPPVGSGLEGDPVYLSPEAFLRMIGREIPMTAAIDRFAFGAIIHRIWTGELPGFDHDKYAYLYEAVLAGDEIRLSASLPDAMGWLVRDLLAADPNKRPDDAVCVRVLGEGVGPVGMIHQPMGDEPLNSLSRFMRKR